MKPDDAIKRIDELIRLADKALGSHHSNRAGQSFLDDEPLAEFRASGLSFLGSLFPPGHHYVRDFDVATAKGWTSTVRECKGILTALRNDISGGWLDSTRGLIAAEIFTDFVDMAEHLLSESYKDAAAVLGGGALEQRLRELCMRHGIEVTAEKDGKDVARKAESLNADLAKADVYGKTEQKNVTAWLGLRNDAAHGAYEKYTKEQVGNYLSGIRLFLSTTNT
jgi:hypothetical protein